MHDCWNTHLCRGWRGYLFVHSSVNTQIGLSGAWCWRPHASGKDDVQFVVVADRVAFDGFVHDVLHSVPLGAVGELHHHGGDDEFDAVWSLWNFATR